MTQNGEEYQAGLAAVAPYTHPDVWDGHTFGTGELTKLTGPSWAPYPAVEFAQDTLDRFMNHPGPRHAVETFRKGMTFEASKYNEGTVLAFRQETLATDNPRKSKELLSGIDIEPVELLRGIPPATKNFTPHPRIDLKDKEASLPGKVSISYTNRLMWGVVAADRKGDPLIVRTPPELIVWKGASARVYTSDGILWPIVKIEGVRHVKKGNFERLGRVSLLEVCSYGLGQRQEKRSGVLDFFRQFIPQST